MSHALHCPACTLTLPDAAPDFEAAPCPRCGNTLHRRHPHALARSTAFALAALIMLVPAYVLPVLTVNQLGSPRTDTAALTRHTCTSFASAGGGSTWPAGS